MTPPAMTNTSTTITVVVVSCYLLPLAFDDLASHQFQITNTEELFNPQILQTMSYI